MSTWDALKLGFTIGCAMGLGEALVKGVLLPVLAEIRAAFTHPRQGTGA